MRIFTVSCLVVLAACSAHAEDLFVGVFESETRANFGRDIPGEFRIEVTAVSRNKYEASIYQQGELLEKKSLISCPVEKDDYLNKRAPGRAEVICYDNGYGSLHGFLSYSENGIYVPAVKEKYAKNPELLKQEGLKPGDPSIFELRHHKALYYAHVQWGVYGFRKVKP